MLYFCRITVPYEMLKEAFTVIGDTTDKLVVYQHEAPKKKTHCHFLIDWSFSTDTLKNRFKRYVAITDKGNTFWTFKTTYKPYKHYNEIPVDDGSITYMSKGSLEPSYVKGFTQDEINKLKGEWIDYVNRRDTTQSALTRYIKKETAQESKLRKDEMIQQIVKYVKESEDTSVENVVKLIRQVVIVEQKTVLGRYQVRDYYDTVMAYTSAPKWVDSMVRLIHDRNFSIH